MVEQRIENPRVGSSSLPPGTIEVNKSTYIKELFVSFELLMLKKCMVQKILGRLSLLLLFCDRDAKIFAKKSDLKNFGKHH